MTKLREGLIYDLNNYYWNYFTKDEIAEQLENIKEGFHELSQDYKLKFLQLLKKFIDSYGYYSANDANLEYIVDNLYKELPNWKDDQLSDIKDLLDSFWEKNCKLSEPLETKYLYTKKEIDKRIAKN